MLQGLWLMAIGMGVVFGFLGLLVMMMKALANVLEPYAHLVPEPGAPTARPAAPKPPAARPAAPPPVIAQASATGLEPVAVAIAAAHAGK